MSELLAHVAGDYVVQSDWMAAEKLKSHGPALLHAASYTACFLPLTRNGGAHYVIDRWRLAKYVGWAKNQLAPQSYRYPWDHADGTGFHMDDWPPYVHDQTECRVMGKPIWMATWLMIIVDNFMHLSINRWALRRWR